MSGNDDKQLALLIELSRKMGVIEELRGDIKCVNREVMALKMQFSAIIILSPEEVNFLRSAMEAQKAERDFWKDQKAKLVGAGLLAAISIIGVALWHYVANLINSGGGS